MIQQAMSAKRAVPKMFAAMIAPVFAMPMARVMTIVSAVAIEVQMIMQPMIAVKEAVVLTTPPATTMVVVAAQMILWAKPLGRWRLRMG